MGHFINARSICLEISHLHNTKRYLLSFIPLKIKPPPLSFSLIIRTEESYISMAPSWAYSCMDINGGDDEEDDDRIPVSCRSVGEV
ncbi:hypothetical protein O6P43_000241 [Quillaja saponaria]|uniref:Uncharacterized protein n=1 Tax=Quillaja saponaria TaxID=32244 RepID=A0AAD7QHF7_QUISA|nr:hypothetical protein O6P43_000241 [Quillaja saponaria]